MKLESYLTDTIVTTITFMATKATARQMKQDAESDAAVVDL